MSNSIQNVVYIVLRIYPMQVCKPVAVRADMCRAIDAFTDLKFHYPNMQFAIFPWICNDIDYITSIANENLNTFKK